MDSFQEKGVVLDFNFIAFEYAAFIGAVLNVGVADMTGAVGNGLREGMTMAGAIFRVTSSSSSSMIIFGLMIRRELLILSSSLLLLIVRLFQTPIRVGAVLLFKLFLWLTGVRDCFKEILLA